MDTSGGAIKTSRRDPRQLTALAPVLVGNVDYINVAQLKLKLADVADVVVSKLKPLRPHNPRHPGDDRAQAGAARSTRGQIPLKDLEFDRRRAAARHAHLREGCGDEQLLKPEEAWLASPASGNTFGLSKPHATWRATEPRGMPDLSTS